MYLFTVGTLPQRYISSARWCHRWHKYFLCWCGYSSCVGAAGRLPRACLPAAWCNSLAGDCLGGTAPCMGWEKPPGGNQHASPSWRWWCSGFSFLGLELVSPMLLLEMACLGKFRYQREKCLSFYSWWGASPRCLSWAYFLWAKKSQILWVACSVLCKCIYLATCVIPILSVSGSLKQPSAIDSSIFLLLYILIYLLSNR